MASDEADTGGLAAAAAPEDKTDNLPSKQANIMERLTSIRENKQKILMCLRGLQENRKDGDEIDKTVVADLIGRYDSLREQEDQYMKLIQNIVTIRENAAEDVQHEVDESRKAQQGEESIQPAETDGNKAEAVSGEATGETKPEDEEVWKEVKEELDKIGSVTEEAVAASVFNEKLVETLQLHRAKQEALKHLRQKETEAQRGAAKDALEQVELARLRVAAEQEKIERKQKTLERLRKEALKRGIKIGPGSASEPDILIEPQPEPKSVTEAKLRAKLLAKKKQNEEQADKSPPIPEDLAPEDRIPPIAANTAADDQAKMGEKGSSKGGKKKKGKKARENAKQKREAINESIREKLAALKARKERIREIRSQLLRPTAVAAAEPKEMDEAYLKAQEQLKNLTAMREHLEELRQKGENLPEEAARMLELHLVEEEEQTAGTQNTAEPVDSLEDANEMEVKVREEFSRIMGTSERPEGCEAGYCLTAADCRRLICIEQALVDQKQLLLGIAARQQSQPHQTAVVPEDRQATVTLLRRCLFNAKPQLLIFFGQLICDIANGKVVPDLDDALKQLLDSADNEFASSESTETEESSKGNVEPVVPAESTTAQSTDAGQPTAATEVVEPGELTEEELKRKVREGTPQAMKVELAKQHLNSGKRKLQKQRTLEKIRCVADEKNPEGVRQDGELEELEKNIFSIVTVAVQWIREHAEDVCSEDLMQQLRDKILETTTSVCFESSPKETYENQLSTIIDNTLSPYHGDKIGDIRQQLVCDISEILYNELAFFQLMRNIDSLVIDEAE